MTNKIIELFQNAGLVNSDNNQIVLLGVKKLCAMLTDLLIAILWSLVLGDILVGIFFEACYSFLRIYAGGYHAANVRMCKYLTYATTLVSILMVFVIDADEAFVHCVVILSIITVVVLAPVEHKNKPLNRTEKKVYRLYCLVIAFVEMGLYILLSIMDLHRYARTICAAIVLVVIGELVEKGKQRINK